MRTRSQNYEGAAPACSLVQEAGLEEEMTQPYRLKHILNRMERLRGWATTSLTDAQDYSGNDDDVSLRRRVALLLTSIAQSQLALLELEVYRLRRQEGEGNLEN